MIALLQVLLPARPAASLPAPRPRPPITCPGCGKPMVIVRTGVSPFHIPPSPSPIEQPRQQAM